jgi:hypothetical protein
LGDLTEATMGKALDYLNGALAGLVFLCVALVALPGCAPVTPVPTAAQTQIVSDAQYGLEATYNLAAQTYLRTAWKTPETKEKARALLVRMYSIVLTARQARAVGDAPTVTAQALALAQLLAQVQELTR